MKNKKSKQCVLIDHKTGKQIELPKIHGNKIINILGIRKVRYGEWKRQAKESNEQLLKALSDPNGGALI